MLLLQVYTLRTDNPRQDMNMSRDVVLVIYLVIGIAFARHIDRRCRAKLRDTVNTQLIPVVTYDTITAKIAF